MKLNNIENAINIILGILIILSRNYLSRKTIESQNALWGFSFGAREIKATGFVIIIVGLFSIVIGMLSIFEIIKTKGL